MKVVLNEAIEVVRRHERVASREVGDAEEVLARLHYIQGRRAKA